MRENAFLLLTNEELLMLGVLAIEGFKAMINEHVMAQRHDIGRLVKFAVLIHKVETECGRNSEEAVAVEAGVGGESDAL